MAKGATLTSGSVLLPDVGMSQSSLMIATLIAGFVVYLAMNGKLAAYWSILMGGGASATPAATTAAPTTTTTPAPSTSTSSGTTTTLPATQGSILGLGGTSNPTAPATGGVATPTGTGILGLPNTSLSNFFGLG